VAKFIKRHKNREDLAGEHKWGDMGQLVLLLMFISAIIVDLYFLEFSAGLNELKKNGVNSIFSL